MVQWLGPGVFTDVGQGFIPGWGTKSVQAVQRSKKQIKNKIKILNINLKDIYFNHWHES